MKIKRISLSITIFITLLFSLPLYAIDFSANCNSALSAIDPDDRYGAPVAIEAAFADYTPYYNEADGVYYLNFSSASTLESDRNFKLVVNGSEIHDIYICNLNIKPNSISDTALITVSNSSNKTVHIINSTLMNVKNGLKLIKSEGSGGFSVANTTLTGDASRSGACLTISADGTVVSGSNISNCGEGIRIEASNVRIEESTISNANTCINSSGAGTVLRGGDIRNCTTEGIRLAGANAVVENSEVSISPRCVDILGDGAIVKGSNIHNCSSEGIRIEASNVLIGAPDAARYAEEKDVIHDNGTGISELQGMISNRWAFNSLYGNEIGIQSSRSAPVLVLEPESNMALRCTRDASGNITRRELHFSGVTESGEMILFYTTDDIGNQGRDFLSRCLVDTNGVCVLDTISLSPPLSDVECGRDGVYATALFTNTQSTAYLISKFEFYSPRGTVVMTPETGPLFTTPGVVEDSGGDALDEVDETEQITDGNQLSAVDGSGGGTVDVPSAPQAAAGARCNLIEGTPQTARIFEIFSALLFISILSIQRFVMSYVATNVSRKKAFPKL